MILVFRIRNIQCAHSLQYSCGAYLPFIGWRVMITSPSLIAHRDSFYRYCLSQGYYQQLRMEQRSFLASKTAIVGINVEFNRSLFSRCKASIYHKYQAGSKFDLSIELNSETRPAN